MKKTTLVAAAILTTVSSVVAAQAASTNSGSPSTPASTTNAQTSGSNLRQQVTSSLQRSGFTNIKVVPDSFLVQAKDKSGNPVTMFIGPNSETEVATVGSNDQASDSDAGNSGMRSGRMFTNVPAKDELTSKVVGLDVYNNANQNIGTIKDVAYNGNNVNGYVIGVGGIIGSGRSLRRGSAFRGQAQLRRQGQEVACKHGCQCQSAQSCSEVQVSKQYLIKSVVLERVKPRSSEASVTSHH